ncbi:MAG: hypothetical protein PHC95_09725 [Parabacteroides sp.]|nr:hypothetical protein [Parabacteroides sp.]
MIELIEHTELTFFINDYLVERDNYGASKLTYIYILYTTSRFAEDSLRGLARRSCDQLSPPVDRDGGVSIPMGGYTVVPTHGYRGTPTPINRGSPMGGGVSVPIPLTNEC